MVLKFLQIYSPFVPLSGITAEEAMQDPLAKHAEEIIATTPAGSVVMTNAHTWHSGRNNSDGSRRRVLHAYYTAREHPQQQDQRRWLTDETKNRLNAPQRWLLDVD